MDETLKSIEVATKSVFKHYGVRSAGVFGSRARGDASPESDIDILISPGEKKLSVWDLVALREELARRLKRPVDLISDRAIVPYFRDYIFRDLRPIYGTR